jgi:predicted phage terminase large subunit-like protein
LNTSPAKLPASRQPSPAPRLSLIERERARRAAVKERERVSRSAEQIRSRCSTLIGFVQEAWKILVPDEDLVVGWHMHAICQHLEAVTSGKINRLLINVPPGSSKSLLVSVFWPAWEWGPCERRSLSYLSTSFKDDPVTRDIRKCRDLIMSDWYKALWPQVRLTRTGETSFANVDKGTREGSAFNSLTSLRANRLIVDDPHSTKTAESDTERGNTTRQFLEGARNRLNDQRRDAIVVVMQRLHADDLSGVIVAQRLGYVHLMIPMEFDPARACETVIGWRDPRTRDGELMDPARFPIDVLDDLKKGGSYFYSGQYQQRPTAREGGLFKRAWFAGKIIARDHLPTSKLRYVRGWDFAATVPKAGRTPDWTVGVLMARHGVDYYVLGMERAQESAGSVRSLVKARAETDPRGTMIRIPREPGQAGVDQAERYIEFLAGYRVRDVRPTGDKTVRAEPLSIQAENGHVYLVNSGPPEDGVDAWIATWLDEVCTFPAASHDDIVDASADAFVELAIGGAYSDFESLSSGRREILAVTERDTVGGFGDKPAQSGGAGFGSLR